MKRPILVFFATLAVCLCASIHAHAADRFWTNPAGGNYTTPGNWLGNNTAGPGDAAIFQLGSPAGYTVTLAGPHQVNQLDVRDDRVTLNLGGATYDVTTETRIGWLAGQTGRVTVRNGTLQSGPMLVGFDFGSDGELLLSGSDAHLLLTDNLYLSAWGGTGQLSLLNGATAETTWSYIANNEYGIASAFVLGAGSSWTVGSGVLAVGNYGYGGLTVADGGFVDVAANWAIVGWAAGSTGHATVTGPGSVFQSEGALVVGADGQGDLLVSDGARVATTNNWGLIGNQATGVGRATITGSGSKWEINGELRVGSYGRGELTISDGGIVNVATWGNIAAEVNSTGRVDVTGPNSHLQISHGTIVGNGGAGELHILDGGRVTSPFEALIGELPSAVGTARVEGAASRWDIGGFLVLGRFGGIGNLRVGQGGRVDVGGETHVEHGVIDLAGGELATAFLRLNNDSVLQGYGAIIGPMDAGADTRIVAAGGKLTVGDASTGWGFAQYGTIDVQSDATLELLDSDPAFLGPSTTLENGVLIARNGIGAISGGNSLAGYGVVIADPILGFAMNINSPTGRVNLSTPIEVGSNTARVYSFGIADLGTETTIAGGRILAPSGVRLGQDDVLAGGGTVMGNVRLENGILHAATGESLGISGTITGYGILVGAVDWVSIGAPTGSVHLTGDLDVGGQTAYVHSIGAARLGLHTTLAGGTISAPAGLIVAEEHRIAGEGDIVSDVVLAGGAIGGSGTLHVFGTLSGHGLLYGTVLASVALPSSDSIAIKGPQWDIGADEVTAFSQAVLRLPERTTIAGGVLRSAAGFLLTDDSRLEGSGTVNGPVSATLGSKITATGPITLGDATSSIGVTIDGHLDVRGNLVALRDANQAVLGALTTLGAGATPGTLNAVAGLVVGFGRNVQGYGTVSTPNVASVPLVNNGAIRGNSPAQPVTLSGYVKGVGTLENVLVTGT
ncbi:MAG: hypothetical protein WD176_07445, partial [Pirellulales bacterium]